MTAPRTAPPELLASFDDPRLTVITNVTNLGLARSLNLGLGQARGRYVARLDADDVAMRDRLELQLAVMRERPGLAVLGSAVMEIDGAGAPGGLHVPPTGDAGVRWHALFGSPFFHPTVVIDRDALERHGLRYDEQFAESEDYDLWTRLLEHEPGDNLTVPLVLRRVHAGQASKRRGELQRSLQRAVALRAIARVAPGLEETEAALAWQLGALGTVESDTAERSVEAFLELVAAFTKRHPAGRRVVARAAARRLAAVARHEPAVWRHALRLDPLLPAAVLRERRQPAPCRCGHATVGASLADRARSGRLERPCPRRRGLARADAVPCPHSSTASPSDPRSTSPSSTRPAPSRVAPGRWSRATGPSSCGECGFRGCGGSCATTTR